MPEGATDSRDMDRLRSRMGGGRPCGGGVETVPILHAVRVTDAKFAAMCPSPYLVPVLPTRRTRITAARGPATQAVGGR